MNARTDNNSNREKVGNKLKDGPCSKEFLLLETCGKRKGLSSDSEKVRMQACPSNTDVLIKCIHKNPLYFQS